MAFLCDRESRGPRHTARAPSVLGPQRGWATATIALILLLAGALPAAGGTMTAEERSAEAKDRFTQGMAHFQLEEYDQAIVEWEAGFRTQPVPEFLYNIAQAYRLSKQLEKALSFYQKYLRMEPKAPNRVEVERHIASLTKVIDEQKRAVGAPPSQPLSGQATEARPTDLHAASQQPEQRAPVTESAVNPQPVAPAPVTAAQPVAVTPVIVEAAPPPKSRIHPWVWAVVGVGAALVVGAVVAGVVVGTRDTTPTLTAVSF